MSTVVTEQDPPEVRPQEPGANAWNPFTRIAFRFFFVYLGLFCLSVSQLTLVFTGWFMISVPRGVQGWLERLLEPVLSWVGRTVFGVHDVRLSLSGSGDQRIDWVLACCVLVVALVATLVWSLLDRRRRDYRRLAGWSLVVLRLVLGAQLLFYGSVKLIPTQMPTPSLSTLLEPYGNFRPMGVLWSQVGSSHPYEMLLGLAEILAGLLLFVPRTALLGAMLALIDMALVFLLNMTFDVPVKILSGHLLLMSLVLLAPEARRLVTVLLLDRTAGPSTSPYPFHTPRARRITALVQVLLAIWVLLGFGHMQWRVWHESGGGRPKPALYGIWTVTRFVRDGQDVPPLVTDRERWYRVVFDYVGALEFQHMDGTLDGVLATTDPATHRITLQPKSKTSSLTGVLTYRQPAPGRAVLVGELNGHQVSIDLQHFDADRLPLRSTGFHWVQNLPEPG
ncbi:DoxX family protein [Nocardia macrotermitis]|uniref:DoxX family protein n=1 Tax=Nocardia macrotermitis TaxID=2585198 RepID=A0A7K0D079_9NOCA|nr:DoxX family protein [Nocardia macrotermitis]MQY18612.1 hypothetical protein [Nocardia macrotermitis]